jgi:hypothetical protein
VRAGWAAASTQALKEQRRQRMGDEDQLILDRMGGAAVRLLSKLLPTTCCFFLLRLPFYHSIASLLFQPRAALALLRKRLQPLCGNIEPTDAPDGVLSLWLGGTRCCPCDLEFGVGLVV